MNTVKCNDIDCDWEGEECDLSEGEQSNDGIISHYYSCPKCDGGWEHINEN